MTEGLAPALLPWATAVATQALLAALGTPVALHGDQLSHGNGFVAQVDWACTALVPALVLAFALFVFSRLPPGTRLLPRITGPLAPRMLQGAMYMLLINQLRLVGVIWVGVHAPAHFGWVHEVAGPLLLVVAGGFFVVRTARRGAQGHRGGPLGVAQ